MFVEYNGVGRRASIRASSCGVTGTLADWLWKRLRLKTDWIIKNTAVCVSERRVCRAKVYRLRVCGEQRKYGRAQGEVERVETRSDRVGWGGEAFAGIQVLRKVG